MDVAHHVKHPAQSTCAFGGIGLRTRKHGIIHDQGLDCLSGRAAFAGLGCGLGLRWGVFRNDGPAGRVPGRAVEDRPFVSSAQRAPSMNMRLARSLPLVSPAATQNGLVSGCAMKRRSSFSTSSGFARSISAKAMAAVVMCAGWSQACRSAADPRSAHAMKPLEGAMGGSCVAMVFHDWSWLCFGSV